MSKTWELSAHVPFPPQVVYAKMTDPAFVEAWTKVQGGLDPSAEIVKDTDTHLVVRIRMREDVKLLKQEINATLTVTWDKKALRNTWKRDGAGADVHGDTLLTADGTGTKWVEHGEIRCGVPLVGKLVEKAVVEDRERRRDKTIRYLTDALRAG